MAAAGVKGCTPKADCNVCDRGGWQVVYSVQCTASDDHTRMVVAGSERAYASSATTHLLSQRRQQRPFVSLQLLRRIVMT